jgi:hypothetical protein
MCHRRYPPRGSLRQSSTHTHEDSRARGSYEDTSICVPGLDDLLVEVDPVVHPGSMRLQEYTRDYMSMQEHTVVSDSSQRHAEVYSGIQRDALDCREEKYLVEHGDSSPLQQCIDLGDHLHNINSCMSDDGWRVVDQQFEELPLVVPDDWGSVMTTSEYLPWVSVDELLVESLRLTKAYDTFQSYVSFPNTFIIDNNIGGDRQQQVTERVDRSRPPDMSALIAYNRIGVDHQRHTIETLGMMVSIVVPWITNISEGDTDSDSHEDEHGGLPTTISMTQKQLVGIGSDKLPSFPRDAGVHLVSRLFHFMMAQVAPESHILHSGLVLRRLAGACPME